jgi:bacillithiol system protein YtxJ
MSNISWSPLTSVNQLQEIDEQSKSVPCMIFKHSTRCSISSVAMNRLDRKWKLDNQSFMPYYLDLIAYRDISNAIADHYGVQHESPQVLVIIDGKCVHSASHFDIEPAFLQEEFAAS